MGPRFLNSSVECDKCNSGGCPPCCVAAGQQWADGERQGKVVSPVWHSVSQRWRAEPGTGVQDFTLSQKNCLCYGRMTTLLQIVRNLFIVAVVDAENLGIFCYPYVWHYVLQSRELCVCFYVCELAYLRPSLKLFQEPALYSVSEALFFFGVCIYSLSISVQSLTARYCALEQGTAVLMGTFSVRGVTGEFLSTLNHSTQYKNHSTKV